MAQEIERKFLVKRELWRPQDGGQTIRQGYLVSSAELSVRVRRYGAQAFLTIKGPKKGMIRDEYEYPIAPADADEMLDTLCIQPVIEKTRYASMFAGREWVVDVFAGVNAGLVLAEVELESEDAELVLPDWAGLEVTDDVRYLNANLALKPFSRW
ncbi:MAG: CYTH domain-containing protein [Defluviicoccus sp.]|nr:CYTH domain-containing protein [Defluviicoccus sp.]